MEELELVKIFQDKMEAEIAASFLESSGITAIIRADDEGGMLGGIQLGARGILLFVKKSDREKAFQLLQSNHVA